jgi:hypothetical protein
VIFEIICVTNSVRTLVSKHVNSTFGRQDRPPLLTPTRQAMYVQRNIEARSRNQWCRGEAISTTYPACSLVNDQRDAQFFIMYLFLYLTLYMFRANRAHHQERQTVSIQPLVTVTLFTVVAVSCAGRK